VRQLQRQFDETTGVSPKTPARTIRFEAIRERLMFDPNANLTDLAYEFWLYRSGALHQRFQGFHQ
jgi:methylphosphotriester-DNA--protein-cysteine methyltransferase